MDFITKGKGPNRKRIPIRKSTSSRSAVSRSDVSRDDSPRVSKHQKIRQEQFAQQVLKKIKMQRLEKTKKIENEIKQLEEEQKKLLEERSKYLSQKYNNSSTKPDTKKVLKLVASTSAKIISAGEPHFAGMYVSYRIAKYGVHFINKLRNEYKITDNWNDALCNVAGSEIQEKLRILLNNKKIQQAVLLVTNNLYYKYSQSESFRIPIEYEKPVKIAVFEAMEFFMERNVLLASTSKYDFGEKLLQIYLKNVLANSDNKLDLLSPEWQLLQNKLPKRLFDEFESNKTPSYSYIGGEFNSKNWLEENIPAVLDIV